MKIKQHLQGDNKSVTKVFAGNFDCDRFVIYFSEMNIKIIPQKKTIAS